MVLAAVDFGRHVRPVGLTGGIACGKSTVAGIMSQSGATIVDADKIAAAVLEPGTYAYKV